MADTPILRLHDTSNEPVDTYIFERRRSLRRATSGQVTVLLRKVDEEGARYRITSMNLLDMSDTGLGGMCGDALEPDSNVSVLFPPHGPEQGFDVTGHIVRSTPRAQGHQIGIRFDVRRAA